MGLFDRKSKLFDFATQSAYSTEPIAQSIWHPNTLQSVLFPNAGGNAALPATVDEAMALPAVSAALGIYSGVCSRFPLTGADWLSNTQGSVTPQLRIATTVQDLIFYNASVWFVARGADGFVNDAIRVHPNRWSIDADGKVLIDGKPFDQNSLIYIAGLKPAGFLTTARSTIRHAAALEQTSLNRSLTPSPITVIKESAPQEATPEEIEAAIEDFTAARQNANGGVLYVPYGLEVEPYGGGDENTQLLIAARMAVRTDLANHLNISSAMVDGMTGNSDAYQNSLQSKIEILEYSFKLYTEPICARLSQNDVTPEGVTVRFDYSAFESGPEDGSGNIGTAIEESTND